LQDLSGNSKAEALYEIAKLYKKESPDSSFFYAFEAVKISKEFNLCDPLIMAYNLLTENTGILGAALESSFGKEMISVFANCG